MTILRVTSTSEGDRAYGRNLLHAAKMLTFALDRDGRDVTDGPNFQPVLDKMFAAAHDEVVPVVIMPGRLCMFLRRADDGHPWSRVRADHEQGRGRHRWWVARA